MRQVLLTAVAVLLASGTTALADGWGHIKGRVVLDEEKVLPPEKLNVNKDQEHCLSNGDLLSEEFVVDSKTKGVRWVAVFIAVEKEDGTADHKAVPPLHDSVAKIKDSEKAVVMDQPCCRFEPHLVILRKGQDLIGKNSSPVSHNMNINGEKKYCPGNNFTIPGKTERTYRAAEWNPHKYPIKINCGSHGWMYAHVWCVSHPYFAVTDKEGNFEIKNVPAGKFRLIMWHDSGWVVQEKGEGKSGSNGIQITVEDGKTLDMGKVPLKYKKNGE
jgi:hypothetical protein